MACLFCRRRKKPPEPSQQPIALSIVPTNTVAGLSGFQVEQDPDPEDNGNSTGPRVVHQGEAQELWASAPEIGYTLHGIQLTREGIDDIGTGGSEVEEITRIAKRSREGPVLGDVSTVLSVAKGTTEKFGPLLALLGAIPVPYAIGKRRDNIVSRIIALEAHFESCPSDVAEQRHRDELRHEFERIEGRLRFLAMAPDPRAEEIPGLLEDLREAVLGYQLSRQTTLYNQGCQLITPDEAIVLNGFRRVRGAGFRHSERRVFLKQTHGTILDMIELWASDFSEPPVYWLNGLAGTGKTTIAQTIAERAFADGWLGASFFCSRDFQDRSSLHLILPALSIQLALKYPRYRSFLVPLIRSDPEIAYESLHNQMRRLIVQPLKEFNISTLIVIDALDECEDGKPTSTLISVLGESVSEIPKVKFFVTGRPETRIQEGFRLPSLAGAARAFVLHEIESSQVAHDTQLFSVNHEFSGLAHRRSGLDNWPTKEQPNLLCTRVVVLFVYAVATVLVTLVLILYWKYS